MLIIFLKIDSLGVVISESFCDIKFESLDFLLLFLKVILKSSFSSSFFRIQLPKNPIYPNQYFLFNFFTYKKKRFKRFIIF